MSDALFSFELQSNLGTQASADAEQLDKLKVGITEDTAALREMNASLRALKGSSAISKDGLKGLQDRISAQKAKVAQAHADYLRLGGAFRKTPSDVAPAKGAFDALKGTLPRPFQAALGHVTTFASSLTAWRVAALGSVAAGALLIGVVAKLGVTMGAYAVAAGDARRSELLQIEGLSKIRNWYGLAADSAGFLQSQVDKVAGSVALERGQIVSLERSLYSANLRGNNLALALEGVAIATSAAGESQGEFYKAMILGGARAQGGIKRVVDDIKARFGGIARAQMLALPTQLAKFRENISQIFAIRPDGFLSGLNRVLSLFSQSESVGKALKLVVASIFAGFGEDADRAGMGAKRVIQGLTLGALRLAIMGQRVRIALKGAFGDSTVFGGLVTSERLVKLGLVTFGALAGAVVAAGVVMGYLAAKALIIGTAFLAVKAIALAPILAIIGAGYLLGKAIGVVVTRIYEAFDTGNWSDLGKNIMDGLIEELYPERLINAVTKLGKSAIEAFRRAIGARSPSVQMKLAGKDFVAGGVVGTRATAPQLIASTRKLGTDAVQSFRGAVSKLAPARLLGPIAAGRAQNPAQAPNMAPRGAQLTQAPRRTSKARYEGAQEARRASSPPANVSQITNERTDRSSAQSVSLTIQEFRVDGGKGTPTEIKESARSGLTLALRDLLVELGGRRAGAT